MTKKEKYVVYTVLFGHSELLNEPNIENRSNIDFICFTDDPNLKSEGWQIKVIDRVGFDSSRESRRIKILAHQFLKEYDVSLYIDNTIQLVMDPVGIFQKFQDENFVCFRHPLRNCIYDEAETVIQLRLEEEKRVREQIDFYHKAGYPEKAGLFAGGFLLRRHHAPVVVKFMERWYMHVLRFSKRDQLSFNFVSWQLGYQPTVIDMDQRENPLIQWPRIDLVRVPLGFDGEEYKWLNPDAAASELTSEQHYLQIGRTEQRKYRYYKTLWLNQLANKYHSEIGNLYYNRHFYSRVYQYYLQQYIKAPISFLEIGLKSQDIPPDSDNFSPVPVLEMWREYFQMGNIYGFDAADFSSIDINRCKIFQGEQGKREDLAAACEQIRPLPMIVIDNGDCDSSQQQISLGFLFQQLQPGGYYFIEDLMDSPNTLQVLKQFNQTGKIRSAYLTRQEQKYLEQSIDFVKFYDSMDYASKGIGRDGLVVIKKKEHSITNKRARRKANFAKLLGKVRLLIPLKRLWGILILWIKRIGFMKNVVEADLSLLNASGYFDRSYYVNKYTDVATGKLDPAVHFLLYGGFEGRSPSDRFDSRWYLDTYPDVKILWMNPLLHYLKFGKTENRIVLPE